MRRFNRFWLLLILMPFALFLSSCDTVSPNSDTIFLNHEFSTDAANSSIRFTFSSNDVSTNRLNDISCNCSININKYLQEQGFQASDLVSATLVKADVIMLFPISKKINFLNQAILKFTASGVSATEVANVSSFPATREVSMNVLPNRDISTFLERPNFGAILQLDPSTLGTNEAYDLSIILKVRLELSDGL